MPNTAKTLTHLSPESSGARLVTSDGRTLPLKGASLAADARAGLARVTLEQIFSNPFDEPLRVTYSLPLPADGAVSGFAFRIGNNRVVGEVDTKLKARSRFEDAILEGRTAAILDQERSSLFTQEVGNVPPHTDVVCEVSVDQKLAFLADGCWEWRFPTVAAPRYLGAPGRVADAAQVTVDVADRALPVKLSLGLAIRDRLPDGARPESPSHVLHTEKGSERFEVSFGDESGEGLDRDVVVRWKVAALEVGAFLDVARSVRDGLADSAFGLLTLVPPAPEAKMASLPRDLIVLLDTSGSMGGAPLDQARRVTSALVDSLGDDDQLELVEFSNAPRRWKSGAVKATASNRKAAQGWLAKLRANGGTEMKLGILEALATLRAGAQRQVVLITDGLIGSETEVLEAISRRLPKGCRVHTVGVGSAVNRSLTQPAARAGRGAEIVVSLGDDAEVAVKRILARTERPLLTDVEVTGTGVEAVAPQHVADLFAGCPTLICLKLNQRGGTVILRGRTAEGGFEQVLVAGPTERGEGSPAVTTLYGREHVEDVELALATGLPAREGDLDIERTGLAFQISTRLTSWIAVSEETTVDARAPRRHQTMPHNLAFGLSAEGLGLRRATAPAPHPALGFGLSQASAPASMPFVQPVAGSTPRRSSVLRSKVASDRARSVTSMEEMVDEEVEGALHDQKAKLKASTAPAAPAAPAPAPALARSLLGKIVRLRDGMLVIEIRVVDAPLAWKPGSAVTLHFADGGVLRADVLTRLTTADGTFAPGLTLTLALEVAEDLTTAPSTVEITNGSELLSVSL